MNAEIGVMVQRSDILCNYLIQRLNIFMSFLIDSGPVLPTKEEKLQQTVNYIKGMSKQTFKYLLEVQKNGVRAVWNQPNLTPQEVIDELGSDALKIFQFHGGLTDYIESVAAVEGIDIKLSYPTNTFTIDQQGKITVTDKPYQP
jgi:hypothetical protein